MLSSSLPKKIEQLVDHLRARNSSDQEGSELSIIDIASVTEVLIGTMQTYFKSVDTTMYAEFRALSEYIVKAKQEISTINPSDINQDKIPQGVRELAAIVQATEEATDTIMEAAEVMMSIETEDIGEYQTIVNDEVMKIFEACSFQDITGQRISKVVETLAFIENRLNSLAETMGIDGSTAADHTLTDEEEVEKERRERNILHGPQLDGEGVNQDDVDALFSGEKQAEDIVLGKDMPDAAAAPEPAPAPAPAPVPVAEAPAPEPQSQDDIDALFASDDAAPASEPQSQDDIDALFATDDAAPASEPQSQDDIDALFASDPAPAPDPAPDPAPGPAPEPEAPAAKEDDGIKLKAGEKASQADIDALFD